MDQSRDGLNLFSQVSTIIDIDMSRSLVSCDELIETADGDNELRENDDIKFETNEAEDDDTHQFVDAPILGRVFGTTREAYNFYNNYSKVNGFGIRVHYSNRRPRTNEIYRVQYVCNKQGLKNLSDKRLEETCVKRRRDTRTDCKAMFQIKQVNAEWVVEKFVDVHNHTLITTPSKVIKFRSHNKAHLLDSCKRLVSELNQEGLTSSKISKVVNVMSKDINITPIQCNTILSTQRRKNIGRECYGVIKHFKKKADLDGSFYFDPDLAEDGTFKIVFWADGRSRAAYAQFGDVVFDVTYKTNKFKFPFAPFVGVNHHGQSILFGAALLEDETETTFTWLFEQFRRCMFDKAPVAIITDQDKAMGNAIAKVFPEVRHRFCIWHVKKHFLEHIQPLCVQFDSFKDDYRDWYKSHSVEEFDSKWQALKEKYEIEENSWLGNMYSLRDYWAKAYLKDTFFAGMTSSQRSESINAFFDGFVNSNTMLNDFVTQYDKAVKSRRDAEEDEDFRTRNSKAVLDGDNPIEAIAGKRYTRKMFEIFKKEWKDAINDCFHEKVLKDEFLIKYKVGKVNIDKKKWAVVDYKLTESFNATCSCAKFETCGILCKHILYIMKKKQLEYIPEQYIPPRWTMDMMHRVKNMCSAENDVSNVEASDLLLWSVREKFNKAIEGARYCTSTIEKLDSLLVDFLVQEVAKAKSQVSPLFHAQLHEIKTITTEPSILTQVKDPLELVKTKGRPKVSSRIKSCIELSIKKQRTCGHCCGKGHYRTGCPILKDEEKKKSYQLEKEN